VVDIGGAAEQSVEMRTSVEVVDFQLATTDFEMIVVAEGVGPVGPQGPQGRSTHVFVQATMPTTGVVAGDVWIKTPPVLVPQPTFVSDGTSWLPIYGEAGAPSGYEHKQTTAATRWSIMHLMHYEPQVHVVNTAGNTVRGAVTYTNNDNLTIDFSEPIAGTAYLS
jgi:hypothetical protein